MNRTLIHRHSSVNIFDIIQKMNTFSINLYSELFIKMMGGGSSNQGLRRVNNLFLKQGFSPIFKNGSGLARTNYMTPKDCVSLLKLIYKNQVYSMIYKSLPEPGEGTLKYFPKIKDAALKQKQDL